MSLKGGDRMNTYITRWLFICTIVVSAGFSYTLEDLRDPTFQPFEDRDIDKWERARMIIELERAEELKKQNSDELESNALIQRQLEIKLEKDAILKKKSRISKT